MTGRRRLPNRRLCESFTFDLDGLRFTASVGRFPDGRIGGSNFQKLRSPRRRIRFAALA
jgi:hypothetical protein